MLRSSDTYFSLSYKRSLTVPVGGEIALSKMTANQLLVNKFKAVLKQLDYEDPISDRDLGNLAGDAKVSSLLEWLCDNVSRENTIADEELKRCVQ